MTAKILGDLHWLHAGKVLDHFPRPRGRNRGQGPLKNDKEQLAKLKEATMAGEKKTTAARRLAKESGLLGKDRIKNRADYLVHLLEKSGK